jgi:uncharacterized protein YndB with AHSA1/START domain
MMEKQIVEHSIWINASRERIWQALTQPEQLMQWFIPNLPHASMKDDGHGKLTVYMGPMAMDVMRLEKLESPRSLTVRALPDELITFTYTLEEENNGTCVKLSMAGFETLAKDAREDRLGQSRSSWEKPFKNLKAHNEGTALPFPQAHVAPLFGYWREIKQTFALERSIWIAAPIERVWQAVTDPIQIEGWFSPGTSWQMSALEVGGRLYIPDSKTGAELHTQIIEVVEPPHRFVIHTLPDASGKSETTSHILREENGGTRFTIVNSGYERMGEETRWSTMEQNTFGFSMILQNAKAFIEGKNLPTPGGF